MGGQVSAAQYALGDIFEDIETLEKVIAAAPVAPGDFDARVAKLKSVAFDLDQALSGHKSKAEVGEYDVHRITSWLWHAYGGVSSASYGPTPAHRTSLNNAQQALEPVKVLLNQILEQELPALRSDLTASQAPWGRGQVVPQ